MEKVNIHQAKTHLSRYAQRVKSGESFLLCERNSPIAEIRPLPEVDVSRGKIVFGVAKGLFEVPQGFDAPMADFEKDFYGEVS